MTFDRPEHKQLIAELLDQATFSGKHAELVVEVRRAVHTAHVPTERNQIPPAQLEKVKG